MMPLVVPISRLITSSYIGTCENVHVKAVVLRTPLDYGFVPSIAR